MDTVVYSLIVCAAFILGVFVGSGHSDDKWITERIKTPYCETQIADVRGKTIKNKRCWIVREFSEKEIQENEYSIKIIDSTKK